MNNSNGVHNESLKKKIPKKKKFGQISIVLNTNKEVKACEKDVEQNIYDFSETMKTKKKSINASENILLKNNEFDAIKKSRKKSKYIKSLNLIECCTNNYTRTKMFEKSDEEVGEQNIIDFYTKNNINPKIKSTVNALAHYKTSEEVSEQNINDSGFWKNLNQTLKSELNTLSDNSLENNSSKNNDSVVTKKLKKKKKHNKSLNSIELNTNNDIEINLFEKNYKEDEEPNIINSWNNISQKQKYKTHALADIDNVPTKKRKQKKNLDNSLNTNHDTEDITFEEVGKQNINDSETINFNIDHENVKTKGPKKKRHNKSLNSIELNPNNDKEINLFENPYKEDEQKINDSSFRGNMREKINLSSNISLENNSSINNDSVVTKKLKKKKKHNKSLNSIELNTNNDKEINLFEKNYREDEEPNVNSWNNISQKQKYKIHALADIDNVPTKKRKQKKNLDNSLNTNHDTEDIIFEEVGKQNINDSETINFNIDNENVKTKGPKKKKHNKSLNSIELNPNNDKEINLFENPYKEDEQKNNDSSFRGNMREKINLSSNISLENNSSINNDSVVTKKLKKKKHNKSLNLIELNTNNDKEINLFEKPYKEDEQKINDSSFRGNISEKINLSSDISLENNSSINNDSVVTKKLKKKKKHNKSLNSIELNTNNDKEINLFEKNYREDEEPNINSWNNISQKQKYKIHALADIDNVPTKKRKQKKNLDNSLNTNHDTEDITFEEVGKQNINDSETINCNIDDENVLDIEFPLKVLGHKNYFRKENEDDISSSDDEMYSTLTHKISKRRNTNHLNMHITDDDLSDISLENNSAINNKSVVTKKIKKIEKHNKSLNSIQLNTNNDIEIKLVKKTYEEDEPNINDSNFRENINLSSDTSSENNSSIDNDNIVTKKLKKKKNHNTNLNSIQLNTKNNLEIESFEKTYKEDEEPNIIDSWNNISQKRKYKINTLEDIDNVPTKKLKKKKNNDNNLNSFEFNTINDSEISQNHFKLKTLLNSMESNDFEGTTTEIETKFNLIKYLKNKEASLQNHPKFKQIKEMLSKKIMGIVNKNCQITNSDIVLLKTIGNIILEKIVEKMNAAQDINGIKITLPAECEENKIHFIETNLGRPPSKEKMNIIKKLNPQVKLRVFNIEEDNLIREYWSKFQKEYNVSNILPFLSNGLEMALDNTQRLQFVRYISAGLPNRLLSSVFIRFNVLFSGHQDKTRYVLNRVFNETNRNNVF
ncbi:unnamed protein product [Aphis gossypii]|uniref:Uncharacterized protein n=1 Tax=Aphis gossypii TaxID=80765 RepID=A0A9P0IPE0_APHGO|nr:unnamed protein product [Aphis gossypii]